MKQRGSPPGRAPARQASGRRLGRQGENRIPLVDVCLVEDTTRTSPADSNRIKVEVRFKGRLADAINRVRLEDPQVQKRITEGLGTFTLGLGTFLMAFSASAGGGVGS